MTDPVLTMCLIARDEAENIERCFSSWWDDVDAVVLCDTGSTDDTINVATQFAKSRRQSRKLKIVRFDWCDDFAKARQAADDAATTEWVTWCDLDDEVHGLGNLRRLASEAGSQVQAFFCHYQYALDPDGNVISELWRERVVRRLPWRWSDRLHEHKLLTFGEIVRIDPSIARWVHHHRADVTHGERNLRILEKWDEDEPNQPRVLHALGIEHMGAERSQHSIDAFRRYLALDNEQADRRAQAARFMAVNLMILNRPEEAFEIAWRSLRELWEWPDTHLTLAECCHTFGRPAEGFLHAKQALELGKPQTMLIVNPLQYTAHPRALMAVCLAAQGKLDEAVQLGEETLSFSPSNRLLNENVGMWRAAAKREHTVNAYVELAQLNLECDEALKAEQLLGCVPFFATDDERIIRQRVRVAAAIRDAPASEVVGEAAAAFIEKHLAEAADTPRIIVAEPDGATLTGRVKAFRLMDIAEDLQRQGTIEEIGVTDDKIIVGAATPLTRPRRGTVAVWTGYAIGPWHPFDITQRGLGGSETAAVRLAEELSAMGYAVSLYGQFEEEGVIGDVLLRDFRRFDPTKPLDVMVGFRNAQRFNDPVNARTNILWLEDLAGAERLDQQNAANIDYICGVSHWHRQNILDRYPWLDPAKVKACRNGITHKFFETEPAPERELRVLYTSSPDRGLDIVLECWPMVRELVPDAELVSTYSRWYDIVAEANPIAYQFRSRIDELAKQPGVTRLKGGLGQGKLAHLMRSSMVWCHPSWYSDGDFEFHETSCISAMEAQAAGLAVVASNWGALTETVQHGFLIDGDPRVKDGVWREAFAHGIARGLKDDKIIRAAREIGPEMVRDMDWRGAAEQLASYFNEPLAVAA